MAPNRDARERMHDMLANTMVKSIEDVQRLFLNAKSELQTTDQDFQLEVDFTAAIPAHIEREIRHRILSDVLPDEKRRMPIAGALDKLNALAAPAVSHLMTTDALNDVSAVRELLVNMEDNVSPDASNRDRQP